MARWLMERMVLTSVKLQGVVGYGADIEEAVKDARAKAEYLPLAPYRVLVPTEGTTLSVHKRADVAMLWADYNSHVIGTCEVWDGRDKCIYVTPPVQS